jgi:MFS family permease
VHVVAFAFMGLFALLQALAGFFSPRVRSRENRLTLTFGVYAVMSLLIVLSSTLRCPQGGTLYPQERRP